MLAEIVQVNTGAIVAAATVLGVFVTICTALVKFGDRLWGNAGRGALADGHVPQTVECKFEHQALQSSMNDMAEAQKDLLRANADFLRRQGEFGVDTTRRLVEIADSLRRLEAHIDEQRRIRVQT